MAYEEKELAKIEKKKAKAELKALKKGGGEKKETLTIKEKGEKPEKETVIIREREGKDWRRNVWLYIVVAIVIGLIVWGLTYVLNKYFS